MGRKDLAIFTKISGIESIRQNLDKFISKNSFKHFEFTKYKFLLFVNIYLGKNPFRLPVGVEKDDEKLYFIDDWKKARDILSFSIEGKIIQKKDEFVKNIEQIGLSNVFIPLQTKDIEIVDKKLVVKIDSLMKFFNEKSKAKNILLEQNKWRIVNKDYIEDITIVYNPTGLYPVPFEEYICATGGYFELEMGFLGDAFSHLDDKYFCITLPEAATESAYFPFCMLAKFFKGEIHAGDKRSTHLLEDWLNKLNDLLKLKNCIVKK